MKKVLILIVSISLLLIAFLFLQKSDASLDSNSSKKRVVTTIYPLYYITKEIAKNHIVVKRLIKPGSEIHSFSPTPRDMVELVKADLFITLGKKLEPWSQKMVKATNINLLSLESGLTLISSHHSEHHSDDHHGEKCNHNTSSDPHVWLDFNNNLKMVDMISKELVELYPNYSKEFKQNALELKDRFRELQSQYKEQLSSCKKDTILVAHDAFAYMEEVYGFESHSITGVFANSKPNASKIVKLSRMIQDKNLTILFYDPLVSSKSATQLAKDRKLELLALYTLGNISLDDELNGKDMLILLQENLRLLKQGLECQ